MEFPLKADSDIKNPIFAAVLSTYVTRLVLPRYSSLIIAPGVISKAVQYTRYQFLYIAMFEYLGNLSFIECNNLGLVLWLIFFKM